jgi:hypothetical protein
MEGHHHFSQAFWRAALCVQNASGARRDVHSFGSFCGLKSVADTKGH